MISIIIPTYNASKQISRLLEVLINQTIKDFEIIVIDSSSTDSTSNIARSFGTNVISILKKEFDHGGTRTLAGKMAKGEYLVYLSQDALPFNKFSIEKLVIPLYQNLEISATYGRQISRNNSSTFAKFLRIQNYPENSIIKELSDKEIFGFKTIFFSDAFAAYRKSVLEKLGWFKEKLIFGEDTYMCAKMMLSGYKISYVSDAKVFHSHDYSLSDEFKRYFDIGVFHKNEDWLKKEFGNLNGEGIRYVLSELRYIFYRGEMYLIMEFFLRNILKLIGYNMGNHYQNINISLCKTISMNSSWWDRNRIK